MAWPTQTLMRMLGNLGVDTIGGSVPLLGDIFDVYFKYNRRNLKIVLDHFDISEEELLRNTQETLSLPVPLSGAQAQRRALSQQRRSGADRLISAGAGLCQPSRNVFQNHGIGVAQRVVHGVGKADGNEVGIDLFRLDTRPLFPICHRHDDPDTQGRLHALQAPDDLARMRLRILVEKRDENGVGSARWQQARVAAGKHRVLYRYDFRTLNSNDLCHHPGCGVIERASSTGADDRSPRTIRQIEVFGVLFAITGLFRVVLLVFPLPRQFPQGCR